MDTAVTISDFAFDVLSQNKIVIDCRMVTSATVDVGSTYSIGYSAIHEFFNTDNPIAEVKELNVK